MGVGGKSDDRDHVMGNGEMIWCVGCGILLAGYGS